MTTDIQQLVEFQSQMAYQIAAIHEHGHGAIEKMLDGISIYRNNLQMTAARSLAITYPVLAKMLGDDAIKMLAKLLLKKALPMSGDWADWGEDLSKILEESELSETLFFLPDIAKLEWCIHRANREKNEVVSLESLNLIQQCEWSNLEFKLQSHVTALSSDYPVAALWFAHRPWDSSYIPEVNELQEILESEEKKYYVLIHHQDSRAVLTSLSATQYRLYENIQQKIHLNELSARFAQDDITKWLEHAVANNILKEVYIHI